MTKVLVAGAGGALAGNLVKRLLEEGHEVRAVDKKRVEDWWQRFDGADNYTTDLCRYEACLIACDGVEEVYSLAADMGGIGFITTHKYACMLSSLITMHMVEAALQTGVRKFFYSSSACVYPAHKQDVAEVVGLKESDVWPAQAEEGYGEQKLADERLCQYAYEDRGLETRVARYHNVYTPFSTWQGGREKAPSAIARKIAIAKLTKNPDLHVWGDGKATRTYMWGGDCTEGTLRIMDSQFHHPLNLGSDELVSVDELVTLLAEIAGLENYQIRHDSSGPQGVRGRSSDNTLIRQVLGWAPSTKLRDGLEKLYPWVEDQVRSTL